MSDTDPFLFQQVVTTHIVLSVGHINICSCRKLNRLVSTALNNAGGNALSLYHLKIENDKEADPITKCTIPLGSFLLYALI